MRTQLQRACAGLARQRESVCAELAAWSPERLRHHPAAEQWSAVEVVDHLVRVERACLRSMREGLLSHHTITLRDRLGSLMVNTVMRLPKRIKVPAGATMTLPKFSDDAESVFTRWRAVAEELREFLESLAPAQLELALFRHPVAGWMRASGAVTFLSAHLRHHRYQISRLRRATQRV